jgi:hypothetical protein
MADCPLVIIRWLDSRQPCGQWRYLSTLPDARPVEVASVGWLVKDTADVKVICQNVGDLEHPEKAQASGIMTIPTRCVLSIEKLTEDESRPNASADFGTVGSTGFVGSEGFAAISDDLKLVSEQMRQAL